MERAEVFKAMLEKIIETWDQPDYGELEDKSDMMFDVIVEAREVISTDGRSIEIHYEGEDEPES